MYFQSINCSPKILYFQGFQSSQCNLCSFSDISFLLYILLYLFPGFLKKTALTASFAVNTLIFLGFKDVVPCFFLYFYCTFCIKMQYFFNLCLRSHNRGCRGLVRRQPPQCVWRGAIPCVRLERPCRDPRRL